MKGEYEDRASIEETGRRKIEKRTSLFHVFQTLNKVDNPSFCKASTQTRKDFNSSKISVSNITQEL